MSYNTYIDESARSGYILAGVNVPQTQQNAIRRVLRNLRAPDSSHIHMYRESRRRQEMISNIVAELDLKAWVISVAPETAKEPLARDLAMKSISEIQSIRNSGILTLDYINRHRADNSILRNIAQNADYQFPHYRHMNSRHEPLLWLPDIVAWCYGRGGPWRDAVEPLVDEVIEI